VTGSILIITNFTKGYSITVTPLQTNNGIAFSVASSDSQLESGLLYPLFYQSHFFKFCPLKHLDVSLLFLKSSLLLCIKVSNFLGAQGALVDADFVNATFQIFACGLLNSIVFRNWKTVWVKSLVSLSYADTFNLATRLRTQPSVLSQ